MATDQEELSCPVGQHRGVAFVRVLGVSREVGPLPVDCTRPVAGLRTTDAKGDMSMRDKERATAHGSTLQREREQKNERHGAMSTDALVVTAARITAHVHTAN